MEFSEEDHGCKKHSNNKEQQGVCPSCLRERLCRLSSVSYKEASRIASSLNFVSADYSSSSNPDSSDRHRNSRYGVMRIIGMSSSFRLKVGTGSGLKKSRSIAFVPRNMGDDDDDDDDEEAKNGKNKQGFWSKLVYFKGKKDVLTHSTSTRIVIGSLED